MAGRIVGYMVRHIVGGILGYIFGYIVGGAVGCIFVPILRREVEKPVCGIPLVFKSRLKINQSTLFQSIAQRFNRTLVKAAVQIQFAIRYLEKAIRPFVFLRRFVVCLAVNNFCLCPTNLLIFSENTALHLLFLPKSVIRFGFTLGGKENTILNSCKASGTS